MLTKHFHKQITLALPDGVYKALKEESDARETSVSDIIRKCILKVYSPVKRDDDALFSNGRQVL